MRIGNRVSVRPGYVNVPAMDGKTGTIIREEPSVSQIGMLMGQSSWTVQFDEPVTICGTMFSVCGGFKEEELNLISA
jgi:hypothetical protein